MSGDPTLAALPTDVVEERTPDPAARVLSWRIEQLIAVGFDSDAAFVLALDRSVDLHDATELVRRGCPPRTAFRILL
jgi:rRNA processing protein Krr1/Pno1